MPVHQRVRRIRHIKRRRLRAVFRRIRLRFIGRIVVQSVRLQFDYLRRLMYAGGYLVRLCSIPGRCSMIATMSLNYLTAVVVLGSLVSQCRSAYIIYHVISWHLSSASSTKDNNLKATLQHNHCCLILTALHPPAAGRPAGCQPFFNSPLTNQPTNRQLPRSRERCSTHHSRRTRSHLTSTIPNISSSPDQYS